MYEVVSLAQATVGALALRLAATRAFEHFSRRVSKVRQAHPSRPWGVPQQVINGIAMDYLSTNHLKFD